MQRSQRNAEETGRLFLPALNLLVREFRPVELNPPRD